MPNVLTRIRDAILGYEAPVVRQDEARPIDPDAGRYDSWQNPFTGLGTTRDKVTQGSYWAPVRIQDAELISMFNGSDLAARIVEAVPKEMMRRGYTLELDVSSDDQEEDPELADEGTVEDNTKELQKNGAKLRLDELVTDAGVWGNLFGGALLIIGAQDGLSPDQPLNEDNISTIRFLNVIDRRFIYVRSYYNDPLSPKYGLPESYLVSSSVTGTGTPNAGVVIHESRCIRFDGARTDILTRQQLSGWSWSLLQRAYDPLRAFENAFQSVANLMSDASQAVFKIQNLISMLASGEKGNLQTRMAMVDMSRSVARAVLLDAENEEFTRESTSFAGLPDCLDRFMMRLSAAVEIPVTILLGRSAAGMNATGDADFRAFYDHVATRQENELKPKLQRLYHLMARAKDSPFGGKDINFEITFAQLWQPSDPEQADIELKTAQKDQIYATIGAVSPEVIALSRWGKNGFNGSGMTAFDAEDAKRQLSDNKTFGNMLQPPPELAGRGAGGQGQQQVPGQALPGGDGQAGQAGAPQAPIGAGASPFGSTKDPRQVLKQLSTPPKPVPGAK